MEGLLVPGLHCWQAAAEAPPRSDAKVPDGHSVARPPLHQLPFGQASQARAPLEEKAPGAQVAQEVVAMALKVPAAQGVQAREPEEVSINVPPLQEKEPTVWQEVEPGLLMVPLLQGVQEEGEVLPKPLVKVFAGQFMGEEVLVGQ